MLTDLKFALRQLAKTPGFSTVAILTLALGIGSVTTIFTFAYGMLIKPLPYPSPEELVLPLENQLPERRYLPVAPATFLHWQEKATDFESMAMFSNRSYNVSGSDDSFRAYAQTSSANFFTTIGVEPALGRNFRPDEDTAGKSNVLILSHKIWQNQFAENPKVIGQSILLDKVPFTIIGVMPKSYQFSPNIGIYTPVTLTADSQSDATREYRVLARLKPGVSMEQSATQLKALSAQLASAYPESHQGYSATVTSVNEQEKRGGSSILKLLLGAVGCLLLIACTNIANLLLARNSARQPEIAVRVAMGAGRGRIVRQLLSESLLLAAVGGALGILLSVWSVDLIRSSLPSSLHHLDQITIDGRVIAFTCILTLFTGVFFGLMPALRASRIDLHTAIKSGGSRGSSGGKGAQRMRSSLVIVQIAMALVLLSSAGLFIRSILKAQQSDLGYESKTTYLTPILFSEQKYDTPQQRLNLVSELIDRVSRVHGIETAAFTNHTGPNSSYPWARYSIMGRKDSPPKQRPSIIHYGVTHDYFNTLKISLIKGRAFDDRDVLGATRVALINQEMARTVFADTDPIGQQIVLHEDDTAIPRVIIGVVGNTQLGGKMGRILPQLYEPYEQIPELSTTLIIRTDGTPLDLKAFNTAFHAIEPDIPTLAMFNLEDGLEGSLRIFQITVSLFSAFALIALLLASMGIYGVIAYNVSLRTTEIGIRMALGAQSAAISKLVMRHSGRLLIIGLVIGLACALGMAQLLRSQLYNTSPNDPLTLVSIVLVFSVAAMLACYLPARRASKIDPIVALRAE